MILPGNCLKKNKETILEGALEGALVMVYLNDKPIANVLSNFKGEFKVYLKTGEIYKIELTKDGYDNNILFIDTRDIPIKKGGIYKFTGAEFILNSFKIKSKPIINPHVGTLFFNKNTGYMEFNPNEERVKKKGLLGKVNEQDNLVELMKRSVLKNKRNAKTVTKSPEKIVKTESTSIEDRGEAIEIKENFALSDFQLVANKGIRNIIKDNLKLRIEEIRKAKLALEEDRLKAQTEEDLMLIREREAIIRAAETELQEAMIMVKLQQSKLKLQSKIIYLSIGGLIQA